MGFGHRDRNAYPAVRTGITDASSDTCDMTIFDTERLRSYLSLCGHDRVQLRVNLVSDVCVFRRNGSIEVVWSAISDGDGESWTIYHGRTAKRLLSALRPHLKTTSSEHGRSVSDVCVERHDDTHACSRRFLEDMRSRLIERCSGQRTVYEVDVEAPNDRHVVHDVSASGDAARTLLHMRDDDTAYDDDQDEDDTYVPSSSGENDYEESSSSCRVDRDALWRMVEAAVEDALARRGLVVVGSTAPDATIPATMSVHETHSDITVEHR